MKTLKTFRSSLSSGLRVHLLRGKLRKTVKARYWLELDRVRRLPGLTVIEVEEGDAGHASAGAQLDVAPGRTHLAAPIRRRMLVATRRGRLRDHVPAAVLEDDVKVAVVLGPDEHNSGDDREDVPLERKARVRYVRRRWSRDQEMDGRLPRWQKMGPVFSVLTVHCSTPQAAEPLAVLVRTESPTPTVAATIAKKKIRVTCVSSTSPVEPQ